MYLHPPIDFLELINMKINNTSLNSDLEINKRQIQMSITPKTSKKDTRHKYRIDPIVSVSIAQNLILQNNRLNKTIRILAQDVILNEISYLCDKEPDIEKTVAILFENCKKTSMYKKNLYAYK